MGSCQPFIEDIRVEAAWTGVPSTPVNLRILLDVVANSRSHISLIRNNHPSVLSTEVAAISKLSRDEDIVAPFRPSSSHLPLREETLGPPAAYPNVLLGGSLQYSSQPLQDNESTRVFVDKRTRPRADTTPPKAEVHFVSYDQQKSSVETAEIPLFSQTASLYEAASSHNSALSPPPPSTSKKLTIPKRLSLEPTSFRPSKQQSPTRQRLSRKDDSSPHSMRKRPVSLDKRPPWRPVGVDDTTARGRKQLGAEVAKRRISRSAGTVQVHRGRTRHRQSSLPGQVPKTKSGLPSLHAGERQNWPKTLPRGRLTRTPLHEPRDRDSTVQVTRYAEALNASERLEKWLEDRRNNWPTESCAPNDLISDDGRSCRIPDVAGSSDHALSPSPTPSSRAALPWTSLRGIRGGGSIDGTYCEKAEEAPLATLIEDNGIIFAFFRGYSAAESKNARIRIEIHACILLEAQPSGCYSLAIPSLPMQGGHAQGTFTLRVKGPSSLENDGFKAYEKVAYIDDDFSTHPLQHDQMSRTFRLDTPFNVKFLCFEACRVLEPSNFEIDSDVHTRYDWENLDGDGFTAEYSMICSIRLHPFLLWADNVKFELYLVGGPSGTLETCLEPGHRRIYLDGKGCDAEHELEISIACAVADLQKTFTISWEQSLGVAPLEIWLPRISGLYRRKLEDMFDLTHEAGVSIDPRPCRRSRHYSMAAQETFLKSSGDIFFFPENQHTPRTIRQSLTEESGQFYDELTAEDFESTPATPVSEDCKMPLKESVITLKPSKRPKTRRSDFLRDVVGDAGHCSTSRLGFKEISETTIPVEDAAGPTEALSVKRATSTPTSVLFRSVLFMIDMLRWVFGRLAAPARVFKSLILIWLCFRAFEHKCVARVENLVISKAKDAWDRWDFEPVQLHGDFTGWKHLMAKVNHGAARVIHDAHLGVLSPADALPEQLEREIQEISIVTEEAPAEATPKEESPRLIVEELDGPSSSSPEAQKEGAEPLTLLDRIDLALGWKPPRGMW